MIRKQEIETLFSRGLNGENRYFQQDSEIDIRELAKKANRCVRSGRIIIATIHEK